VHHLAAFAVVTFVIGFDSLTRWEGEVIMKALIIIHQLLVETFVLSASASLSGWIS